MITADASAKSPSILDSSSTWIAGLNLVRSSRERHSVRKYVYNAHIVSSLFL
jgi:hypothetical protein